MLYVERRVQDLTCYVVPAILCTLTAMGVASRGCGGVTPPYFGNLMGKFKFNDSLVHDSILCQDLVKIVLKMVLLVNSQHFPASVCKYHQKSSPFFTTLASFYASICHLSSDSLNTLFFRISLC